MLPEIRDALRQLLYEHGNIERADVDVRFDAPTREWVDSLTRPTLSLFLYNLRENTDLRQNAFQQSRTDNGAERRLPPRRIDLWYLVSALTAESIDEEALLWRTLTTLMKHQQLPGGTLSPALRELKPPLTTRVILGKDGPNASDLWDRLGVRPHPALIYVVTAPLDLDIATSAPLVLSRTLRYRRADEAHDPETHAPRQVTGVVRDAAGAPLAGVTVAVEDGVGRAGGGVVTAADGRFALHGIPSGPVTLRLVRLDGWSKTVTAQAADTPGDLVFA